MMTGEEVRHSKTQLHERGKVITYRLPDLTSKPEEYQVYLEGFRLRSRTALALCVLHLRRYIRRGRKIRVFVKSAVAPGRPSVARN